MERVDERWQGKPCKPLLLPGKRIAPAACPSHLCLPSHACLSPMLPPRPAPVTSEDDGYAKAYFRRAVLAAQLGDEQAAQDDLALCAAIDPSTAGECERELRRMEKRAAAAEAKQAAAMKGFLGPRQ